MTTRPFPELLAACLAARAALFDAAHESAFRLFNGFTEGLPDLTIDLYGSTVVITNYADPAERAESWIEASQQFLRVHLPWLRAAILKVRNSSAMGRRRGVLLFGEHPDMQIREHGVWYAVNPVMHQDAGLYLDTRNLRRWALEHLKGKTVLNAFSYTGSLGIAALAGGATRAVQLDRNQAFLDVARRSSELNGFPVRPADFVRADFFRQVGAFKQRAERFDCVILDPPFFSTDSSGVVVVDLARQGSRLINKIRPLVNDGGHLVTINNAVYVSGAQYMQTLETLCADGYLKLLQLVPVPDDFAGYPNTRAGAPITDPAPFNHSTKIAILQVRRKDNLDQ